MLILIGILLILLVLYLYSSYAEPYGEGAYIQLMAKDAQDTYLTGDAWKHMYYPYYDPYYGYVYGYPFYYGGNLRPKKSYSLKY